MKFLFIDDNREWLNAMKRCFSGENVIFAECRSVEEALKAIETHKPDAIFLDHQLTEEGNEGFEVAGKVAGGVKIYSTTSHGANSPVGREYQRRGIEHIGKTDLAKFKTIITE